MAAMAKALPNSVGCGSSKLNFLDHCHSAPLARLRGGMDTVQLGNEIQQLKAEVVELKAEVERLKAAVVVMTYVDAKQTMEARLGPTIVVGLTEDEAKEMRDIAEWTRELAQQMLYNKTDMCSPCSPQGFLADLMEDDGNTIVTLSSRLLELLREQSRLRGELHGHYARVRERDEEILARAFPTAPDDAVPDDSRDAVDTAVRQEAEKTSHDG